MNENPGKQIPSDSELIRAVIAGSEEAWRILYEKHNSLFYKFGRILLGKNRCVSPDVHADDICADAWDKGSQKIHTLRDRDSFVPWMFKIITRDAIHHLQECVDGWLPLDDMPDLPDGRIIPINRLIESSQQAAALLKKARSISSKFGEIFYLHDVKELTHMEIAALLNETYDNVRNIYSRGVRRLRKMLEE